MPPYDDPMMQDQEQQMQMRNQLRNRMAQYGGVTPMNFNPEAQGAFGFAPSMAMDNADQMPPPQSMAPQVPPHMQMQQNRMQAQRAMANRNNMMQAPPMNAQPSAPPIDPYRAGAVPGKAMPDFSGMRNAAMNARNAAAPGKPMGRVAAGLNAASTVANAAKKRKAAPGPMVNQAPPTF